VSDAHDAATPGGHAASTAVSADFVFGTLATDDQRLAQLRATASGVHHGHDLVPLDPRPGEPVTIRVSVGPAVAADRVTAYVTTDGSEPGGERGVARAGEAIELARVGTTWDTLIWGYRETWAGTIPGQLDGTTIRYRIEAWSEHAPGSTWASDIAGVVAGERPPGVSDLDAAMFTFAGALWPIRRTAAEAVHVDDEHVPDWLRDAVIYQVFVDRFATTGDAPFAEPATPGGFYGGTLRGVIEHLDHIVGLGVTCIWLSPVFPSPSHHGYDATDYASIEPRLGSEADLRELVELAHQRGLRLILDFAVNHVSSAHPAFVAALADADAPEAAWFTFTRWPDDYLSFFGVADHPQIDADDPGARAYMVDCATHWLALGVDGFRCDYAQGPSHAFWSAFRAATRSVDPDSITLGEIVETPALQRTYAGRLDGCLDFIGQQALRGAFAFGTLTPTGLDDFLRRHLAFMPGDFVRPTFLDNHDMNRFLWVVGGDTRRLRLAAMCQFTLPDPPIVYYGTEVGLSQERDVRSADGSGHPEESRLPMPWGAAQDAELLDFYQALIGVRRGMGDLWRSTRTTLLTDDTAGGYAYACGGDSRRAVVALNLRATPLTITIEAAAGLEVALGTDGSVRHTGTTIELGPYGGAILA